MGVMADHLKESRSLSQHNLEKLNKNTFYKAKIFSVELLVLGLLVLFSTYISRYLFTRTAANQCVRLRKQMLKKLLSMKISFFENNNSFNFASFFDE